MYLMYEALARERQRADRDYAATRSVVNRLTTAHRWDRLAAYAMRRSENARRVARDRPVARSMAG